MDTEQILPSIVAVIGGLLIAMSVLALTIFVIAKFSKMVVRVSILAPLELFLGAILGIIADVKTMGLLSSMMSVLAYYRGKDWYLISMIISAEFFCISALYIAFYLYLEFVPDALDEKKFGERFCNIVKLNTGFWGILGCIIAFSLIIFQVPTFFDIQPFSGIKDCTLYYHDAFLYSFQVIIDKIPLDLAEKFNWKISNVEIIVGYNYLNSFLTAYELIILAVFTKFGLRLWNTYKKRNKDKTDEVPPEE